MNYKLVYHPGAHFGWGVTLWITRTSEWIEQAQFLFRFDAQRALKHWNQRGYLE